MQPQQARYGCVIVRRDSRRLENKTGRLGFKSSSSERNANSRASTGGLACGRADGGVRNKNNIEAAAVLSVWSRTSQRKHRALVTVLAVRAAPGNRLKKQGRSPLRGISGSLSFSFSSLVGMWWEKGSLTILLELSVDLPNIKGEKND